jgi:hypothetical protein
MELETNKTLEKTIVVPEHVSYPEIRLQVDDLQKGDKISIKVTVKDKDNGTKTEDNHKITLREFPDDPMTVVARININLSETIKYVAPEGAPEEIPVVGGKK